MIDVNWDWPRRTEVDIVIPKREKTRAPHAVRGKRTGRLVGVECQILRAGDLGMLMEKLT